MRCSSTEQWTLEDYRNIDQYNWQDEIFQTAWQQSHTVRLTGGTEGVRYNACLLYTSSLLSYIFRLNDTNIVTFF